MPFIPPMLCTLDRVTGIDGTPADTVLYTGEPCAFWHSRGRGENDAALLLPPISSQVAMSISRLYDPPGLNSWPRQWLPRVCDIFIVHIPGSPPMLVSPVYAAPMWAGLPESHARFSCTPFVFVDATPPAVIGDRPIGADGAPLLLSQHATFDVYRPFGAAVPVLVAAPGDLYADPYGGRGSYSGGNYYTWTDILQCQQSVDVRDGMARVAGSPIQAYSDGDEVRFPTGIFVTRYVVVRVYEAISSLGLPFKRVYLSRDQAHWPGP